jgi:hypothetical protein
MRHSTLLALLAALLMAPAVAIAAPKMQPPTAAITPKAYPIIVVSFIAGADPDALEGARTWANALQIGGKACWVCKVNENTLDVWINKTNFWLPGIYRELVHRSYDGAVVLDPLVIRRNSSGDLILDSKLDLPVVPQRLLFIAYHAPAIGVNGDDSGYTSKGRWLSPMIVDLPPQDPTLAETEVIMRGKGKATLKYKKVPEAEWATLMRDLGAPSAPARWVADATMPTLARASVADRGQMIANYRSVLGPAAQSASDATVTALLNGELKFQTTSTASIIKFLTEGGYADSQKKTAQAEDDIFRKQNEAGMMAFLAQAATLGAATPLVLAGQMQALQAVDKMGKAQGQSGEMLAPVLHDQVTVSADILGVQQQITATSVDELREKFRRLLLASPPTSR